jgi:hypothetical protein
MKRLLAQLLASCLGAAALAEEEQVTFYSTFGYKQGGEWVIPLRVWVHEDRASTESAIARVVKSLGDVDGQEMARFRSRIAEIVADSESGEDVRFQFDKDPDRTAYRVRDKAGKFPDTDLNGLVEGEITLSDARAKLLLERQASAHGWLTFRAVSPEHRGEGRVRLIPPSGVSVISDVDDTVKITEIPAGKRIVVKNTFFREFAAAPEMAAMYRGLGAEVSFHYVSGAPWQLYAPLSEFLFGERGGFPEGSFHMKNVRKNLFSSDTWNDLQELAEGDATVEQKLAQISGILCAFPERRFILIGDSGEKDPEIYREIKARFPEQVREIRIRDVVDHRVKRPARLEGMTVIPAPAIVEGVSRLGE